METEPLVWGVQTTSVMEGNMQYNLTASYLTSRLNRTVEMLPIDQDAEFLPLLQNNSLDFITAGPSLTACLQAQVDITSLGTILSNLSSTIITGLAGIIFTAANNTDIKSANDIRGQTVVGGPFTYLSAFQAEWGYLEMSGIDLFSEAANIFLYQDANQVVLDVAAGKYPIGFASAATPSNLVAMGTLKPDSVRVLNPRTLSNFPYYTTTQLYPNSQLSVTSNLKNSNDIIIELIAAFSDIPQEAAMPAQIAGFAAPFNLFETLRLQTSIGVQQDPFEQCNTLTDITRVIRCKSGYHRDLRPCTSFNVTCPANATCICSPCIANGPSIGSLTIKQFVIVIVFSVLILLILIVYIVRVRQLAIPAVKPDEISLKKSDFLWKSQVGQRMVMSAVFREMNVIVSTVHQYRRKIPWRYLGIVDDKLKYEALIERRAEILQENIVTVVGFSHIATSEMRHLTGPEQSDWLFQNPSSHNRTRSQKRLSCLELCRYRNLVGGNANRIMVQVFLGGELGTVRHLVMNPGCFFDETLCLTLLVGIAKGMLHLQTQSPPITGLNIRSHNILLGPNCNPQLMADLTEDSLLDRWQAPEELRQQSLQHEKRKLQVSSREESFAKDMYTFAMLMYEILHRRDPFHEENFEEIASQLMDNNVLDRHQVRPSIVKMYDDDVLYDLMLECWHSDPSSRPQMSEVLRTLQQLLNQRQHSNSTRNRSDFEDRVIPYPDAGVMYISSEGDNASEVIAGLVTLCKTFGVRPMPTASNTGREFLAMATDRDACRRLADLAWSVLSNDANIRIGIHLGNLNAAIIPQRDPVLCPVGPIVVLAKVLSDQAKARTILVSEKVADVLSSDRTIKAVLQRRPGIIQNRGLPDMHAFWLTF